MKVNLKHHETDALPQVYEKAINMSRLLVVIAIILSYPAISFSQEPPPKANTIIITTTDKVDAAFRNMGRLLSKEGFQLQTTEPALLMLTTKVTERKYGFLGMGTVAVQLSVQIDESDSLSQITLTGRFSQDPDLKKIGVTGTSFDKDSDPIEFGGMSGSPLRASWEIMNDVATKYKNGKITYEVSNEDE